MLGVDLHTWMRNDVADVHRRLHAVLDGVPPPHWSSEPPGGGPSVAHLALHLARHQDLAVTTAVRDQPPLFLDRRGTLGLADVPAWAAIGEDEDRRVTAALDNEALVAYVDEVFERDRRRARPARLDGPRHPSPTPPVD